MTQEADEAGWVGRIHRSHIIAILMTVSTILVGLAAIPDALDRLAVWVGFKPSATQIAVNDARAKFTLEFGRAAWERYYLMFRYVALVKGNNPDSDRERVWNKYQEVLEAWNRDLRINELSLKQYFGDAKRDELTHRIQPQFSRLHSCLEGLRTPTSSFRCQLSPDRDIAAIEKGLGRLQHDIDCFVMGLPETNAAPGEPPPRECLSGGSS